VFVEDTEGGKESGSHHNRNQPKEIILYSVFSNALMDLITFIIFLYLGLD
jgi:hypothetical protein